MAAVLLAGTNGVVSGEVLTWADCEADPSQLTPEARAALGIKDMLPSSLEEALQALREDETMTKLLGPAVVERYINVKEFELHVLGSSVNPLRRQWLLERY